MASAEAIGQRLCTLFNELKERAGLGDVRGKEWMVATEFRNPGGRVAAAKAKAVQRACLATAPWGSSPRR